MAFEKTPRGTYGTSMNALVLTTVGAKTGQRRAVLLGSFPDGDGAWRRITAAQPRYAGYEKKIDRQIPVVRLKAM